MKPSRITALFGIAVLAACSSKPAEVDQKGANVFPASAQEDSISITMGDVMPFYDEGTMHVYHLRNITGTNSLFYHPIARISTKDYIHYENNGVALNYEESVTSVDAALGTGSFIKGKDGVYHCFYPGHNDKAHDDEMKGAGLRYNECLRHATSEDGQKTWQKDEDFILYGWADDFRDPYVYYDAAEGKYNMLVTTREDNKAIIARFQADSLYAKSDEWRRVANFFVNDAGNYNMECPSFLEWNGFQYLAYSEQGENRVTHYRYRAIGDENWIRPDRDAIDASGFYAGRLEKAGERLFAFAWCARLTGGNTGAFDWAGNLVTHELTQKENGELCPIMPHTYKDYFAHDLDLGQRKDEYAFDGGKFTAAPLGKIGTNCLRLSMKVKPEELEGDFGITFGLDAAYPNRLGDGTLTFDLDEGKVCCHNNVSNVLRYGPELTMVSYPFEAGKTYQVDVIVSGEIYSVYLDGEVAMTARLINMVDNHIAIYSNHAKTVVSEVKFYE